MSDFKLIRPTTIADTAGTFTRASTGTYLDSDGLIKTAAIDVPRIDYDPVTHAHTGLIIEAAATNLLTYSEQFDNAAWTKTNATITANSLAAPDGTTNADSFIEAAGSSQKYMRVSLATVGPGTYTLSIYAKTLSGTRYLALEFDAGGGETRRSFFDVANGTVTSNYNSAAGSITAIGGGWYRCAVTVTMVGAASLMWVYISNSSSSVSGYTGNGTSGLYLWGAQLETGTAATSYIPTTTAAVTRAADTITGTGLIYSDVPETDAAAWNAATNYTVGTQVIRTTAATHKIYENLIAGVNATAPENALTGVTPRWLEISPTNKWAMFDGLVGTATTQATSMTYILAPGRCNSVALLEVDATLVELSLNVSGETVYSASMDLAGGNLVGDWYQYFYEPVYQQDAVVVTDLVDATLLDLPAYSEGILTVRISKTSGDVSCGALVVGLYANLGLTQYNPKIGIRDYSRKTTDEFGRTTVVQRGYSKTMGVDVDVDSADVDYVTRVLAQYRSTPLVWVGAGSLYTSMIIYGFYVDWSVDIANVSRSKLSLTVEGLT